jgi:hypothetical protein
VTSCRDISEAREIFAGPPEEDRDAVPMKRINKSKSQRPARPAVVEFGVIGVAIGGGCGLLTGFLAEIITQRPSGLTMLMGGFVGSALGGVFELLRFSWRKFAGRKNRK